MIPTTLGSAYMEGNGDAFSEAAGFATGLLSVTGSPYVKQILDYLNERSRECLAAAQEFEDNK